MQPFTKILVPVDFSQYSSEATAVAVDLAQRYAASLHLIHVFQAIDFGLPEGFISYGHLQLGEIRTALNNQLTQLADTTRNSATSKLEVTSQLLQGFIAPEITRYAKQEGFDLIVMGTRGRTGISHLLMGSVAERVLRTAHCPVLSVRVGSADGTG